MTHQSERPAAIWMDRLSDRIGSLIPGGYRLPPRHPAKVSLVMGLLVAVNWCLMQIVAVALMAAFAPRPVDSLFIPVVFLGFAIVVLVPWSAWLGTRLIWQLLLVPYFILMIVISARYGLRGYIPAGENTASLLRGLEFGAFIGIAGLFLKRRWQPGWLVATMVVSAFALWSALSLIRWLMRSADLDSFLRRFIGLNLNAPWAINLGITPYFLLMSLCMGYLIWDRTPRRKFTSSNVVDSEQVVS